MNDKSLPTDKSSRKTIGVVGGGQLALMLAQAAKKRDVDLIVQTPSMNDPAVPFASDVILCDTNDINPGGDDNFAASRVTMTIGDGKMIRTEEYIKTDDGNCSGEVAVTERFEISVHDNGTKQMVNFNSDNISVAKAELVFDKVFFSFNDLSYISGLIPDNESTFCGESYWTGVEREVTGCKMKNKTDL